MGVIIALVVAYFVYKQGNKIEQLTQAIAELRAAGQGRGALVSNDVSEEQPFDGQMLATPYTPTQGFMPHTVPSNMSVMLPPEETFVDRFFAWIKQDFMVKLGSFLLILAFSWFVSYAISNGWIGPMGQIAFGLIAGIAFMVLGVWRITTREHQGAIFTVLGSTIILMTLLAARLEYGYFDPYSALFLMFLSIAFVAFVSVRYARMSLAFSGLVLAGLAPMLIYTGMPDSLAIFTYLLVMVLGTLWVVYLRGWSILTFTAFIIVFLHGLPYMSPYTMGDQSTALLFAFIFTAIFFVANILGLIANESPSNRRYHILIALATSFYLVIWVLAAAAEEWQSLLLVAWMLVFTLGSFVVYRAVESRAPFYIYGATSLVLLAAATAIELSGPTLTLVYTLEVAALVLLATRLFSGTLFPSRLSWLFLGPILLSIESVNSSAWMSGVLHNDLVVLVVLGSTLAIVGAYFHYNAYGNDDGAASTLLVTGAIYGLGLIWLVLHAGTGTTNDLYGYSYYDTSSAAYQLATTYSLIIYTLIAIAASVYGRLNNLKGLALGGSILLGCVIARLLFVEVWQMEIGGRIVTFFIIGTLLILTAFIRRHRQSQAGVTTSN